jgi:membrane-bound lytic murein transglycosylase B
MRRSAVAVFLVSLTVPLRAGADLDERGWRYLVDRLIADGVDGDTVLDAFQDPRMPAFTGLDFSPDHGREPSKMYRHFLRSSDVTLARRCRQAHADAFENASRSTDVPAGVLTAILFVETGCGRNTGSYMILYRLARLAMANEPGNLKRNLWRFSDSNGTIDADTEARLRARARYLDDTFYPEVRATFTVARQLGVSPLAIRGSPSGAFGYPQFLPTSYLRHGTDGDGDGEISLYNTADAAASAARYLAGYGWRPGLSRVEQRRVIWYYNHSDAYIDTVLALAARIDGTAAGAPRLVTNHAKRTRGQRHKMAAARPKAGRRKATPARTKAQTRVGG